MADTVWCQMGTIYKWMPGPLYGINQTKVEYDSQRIRLF